MPKTSTLIDLTIGMTDADKLAVGSQGQVMLKTVTTDEDNIITSEDVEFFDTVVLAQAELESRI